MMRLADSSKRGAREATIFPACGSGSQFQGKAIEDFNKLYGEKIKFQWSFKGGSTSVTWISLEFFWFNLHFRKWASRKFREFIEEIERIHRKRVFSRISKSSNR